MLFKIYRLQNIGQKLGKTKNLRPNFKLMHST
jgi:hypothetical protein